MTKQDGKYDFKKSKPWNEKEYTEERGIFDNVSLSDVMHGLQNRGNAKRFARHKFRQHIG